MKNTICRAIGRGPLMRCASGVPARTGSGRNCHKARTRMLVIALTAFLPGLLVPRANSAVPSAGEQVSGRFGTCAADNVPLCVVDGDTFRIAERRVRVVGIDTAETRARCSAEREQAALSTRALLAWLNRGPFTMTPNPPRAIDRYGRELQVVARINADGRVEALADWMQAEGGARPYGGGARSPWC